MLSRLRPVGAAIAFVMAAIVPLLPLYAQCCSGGGGSCHMPHGDTNGSDPGRAHAMSTEAVAETAGTVSAEMAAQPARAASAPPRAAVSRKPAARKTVYTCPMHREVRVGEPGQCPKCGMDLERVNASAHLDHKRAGAGGVSTAAASGDRQH